jgi:hypothetical protein
MKQLQDNLVWMLVILAVFGTVKLSTVDWRSSSGDLPGQAERGAMLDQKLAVVKEKYPDLTLYGDQQ